MHTADCLLTFLAGQSAVIFLQICHSSDNLLIKLFSTTLSPQGIQNHTVFQKNNFLTVACHLRIMSNYDNRSGFGIQIPCWLIRQYQVWIINQCPANCHSLLFSSGELIRILFEQMFNLKLFCITQGSFCHDFGLFLTKDHRKFLFYPLPKSVATNTLLPTHLPTC